MSIKNMKIRSRPIIDEGFRTIYMEIITAIAVDVKDRAARNGAKAYFERNTEDAFLLRLCMETLKAGRVPDAVLVKLYGLEFEKFSGFTRRHPPCVIEKSSFHVGEAPLPGKTVRWLVGITRPVEMISGSGYDTKSAVLGRYRTGRWYIYLPETAFLDRSLKGIHIIPEAAPLEDRNRHPHHYAVRSSSGHPLDWMPYTCVGGFGTVFGSLAATADIPECFRLLHTFVSRANLGSILTQRPEYIPWIRELNKEEHVHPA